MIQNLNSNLESWEGWSFNQDDLKNIERVEFADAKLALDIDGNAGTTAKILGAFLGASGIQRADLVGVGLDLLDSGTTYEGFFKQHSMLFSAKAQWRNSGESLLWNFNRPIRTAILD